MNLNTMSDNAFWAIVVSVISVCLTTMILGLMVADMVADVVETRWYIRAGYTKTILPGRSAIVWVKEAK